MNRQQGNNTIVNNAVDEILLNETQKLCAMNHEAPAFLDSEYNENDLYQVDKMIFEETKKNLTGVIMRLNTNRKNHMGLTIEMIWHIYILLK